MTQEQILEFNKKCAKFIGATPQSLYPENKDLEQDGIHWKFPNGIKLGMWQNYTTANMKFHSDWNWIHEVMQVIFQTVSFKTVDECTEEEWYATIGVTRLHMIAHKEAAVEVIRRFLDWYYESK
jgi:hypothetical protein